MPKKDHYLQGGFLHPLNWAIWFFNQINKYIKYIQKIPEYMFAVTGIFSFMGSVILLNYFIQELLLKLFCLIVIVFIIFMGFHFYSKNLQRINIIVDNKIDDKKIEKITRGLKDE